MVLSVSGAVFHFCCIFPVAKCFFLVAGSVAKIIIFLAEKIGMLRHSTVAVTSEYFKVFLDDDLSEFFFYKENGEWRTALK